ncbi:MAG: carbamate kinase [Acidimicrobiia bacterium]
MRLLIALGGNALSPRRQPLEFEVQRLAAERAARALGPVLAANRVILTHGNGPQVGLLALQGAAFHDVELYPLDVLVAETEGMIGYILETAIDRVFEGDILTMLTRTVVDPADRAFDWPTKPIGPVYDDVDAAQILAGEHRWALAQDGDGVRRVVASPEPQGIVQADLIGRLADQGVLVICAGGGGVPVVDHDGWTEGIEAVVDKDLASALLAQLIGAEMFISLTDVPAVVDRWGTDRARQIKRAAPDQLRSRSFAPGSMGPKVEAACRFLEATGGTAGIGRLEDAAEVVAGTVGTRVTSEPGIEFYE